jgi:electron transport complex protein RnfG
MTPEAQPQAPPMPSSAAMIRTLGLIAMIAGLLVVLAFRFTDPIIREKEHLALEKAVFQVIPGVEQGKARRISFALDAEGLVRLDKTTAGEANLFAVYDSAGELAGIALQGSARGYQDVVHTLYGYDPDCECIVGFTIMKSTDTPGMGDKKTVEGNAKFMANFDGLSAKLTADKGSLAHPIETVKHGTKTQPWEVDAISGATISSRAIGKGLRESTGELLPLIAQHLPELKAAAETEPNPQSEVIE